MQQKIFSFLALSVIFEKKRRSFLLKLHNFPKGGIFAFPNTLCVLNTIFLNFSFQIMKYYQGSLPPFRAK